MLGEEIRCLLPSTDSLSPRSRLGLVTECQGSWPQAASFRPGEAGPASLTPPHPSLGAFIFPLTQHKVEGPPPQLESCLGNPDPGSHPPALQFRLRRSLTHGGQCRGPTPPTTTRSPWPSVQAEHPEFLERPDAGQGIRGMPGSSPRTLVPLDIQGLCPRAPCPSAPDLCNASGWPWLCCPPASGRLSQAHSLAQLVGLGQLGGWNHPRRREKRTLPPSPRAKTFQQPDPAPLPATSLTPPICSPTVGAPCPSPRDWAGHKTDLVPSPCTLAELYKRPQRYSLPRRRMGVV